MDIYLFEKTRSRFNKMQVKVPLHNLIKARVRPGILSRETYTQNQENIHTRASCEDVFLMHYNADDNCLSFQHVV